MLGEDLIGLLGSAFEGDFEAGAADFDLLGLASTLGDSVVLAGVNFSGAWDLLDDLPRPSGTSMMLTAFLAGGGMSFLAVVVLAEVFMGEVLAAGVIFFSTLTGEADLALTGYATSDAAALDDLLGSGAAAFFTDALAEATASFLTEGLAEATFLTEEAFLGDSER